jgi:CheY-like chemotaxis protein
MARGPILVVDDNTIANEAISMMLSLRGYETTSAYDGLDALTQLRDGLRPSLIILDWMMPNVDGEGFLAQMSTEPEFGSIPTVVYTAYGRRVVADGVAATVSKQQPDVLLDVIGRLCPPHRAD